MTEKILYTIRETQALLEKDAVQLVDIRDQDTFGEGHIPGAVNLPEIFSFLSESSPEGLAALQNSFAASFSRVGLSHGRKVIFYEDSFDTRYGASCRGYWLARYLGHRDCGILDGGFWAWLQDGLPEETAEVMPTPSRFIPRPNATLMATKEDVLKALGDARVILLDNRDANEWLGQTSSPYGFDFAPRRGRIPGARWIEWYNFMSREPIPAFRPAQEVRALCASQQIYPDSDIIIFCFKGSRAANTYVALKLAGFSRLRVYFASWNEWARDPSLPVESGEPGPA
ncbi:sulfurtransferase [Thiovibrio frasassiensis]|uniref:Sulfurtransferase n=1 Tax=Thiovibrio frasassiensis TaxID=2984131 RepID=A0A9X4RKR8_9BACT|nr:sulfurtransferase [Thiovibrio frasassiensis]MDG4475296.1 sulfurtransferase [Thiovibrio frasassiensis]